MVVQGVTPHSYRYFYNLLKKNKSRGENRICCSLGLIIFCKLKFHCLKWVSQCEEIFAIIFPIQNLKCNQYKTNIEKNDEMEENYDKLSPSGTYEGRGEWGRLMIITLFNKLVCNTEMPIEYEITNFF